MRSGYKIKWTEQSSQDILHIIQYLKLNWTEREISKFFQSVERSITAIRTFPYAFPASLSNPQIRRCVASKLNIIYYSISETEITILSISDNRKNK